MTRVAVVTFVEPVGERGGAQNLTLSLIQGLDRSRFQPRVVCLAPGPLVDELRRLGVPVHAGRRHRFRELHRSVATILWLAGILRGSGTDIVHVNGTKTLAYGGPAGRMAGARILWHLFDPPPRPPSWIDRVARTMPRDRVISISPITSDRWGELLSEVPPVIAPGIPVPVEAVLPGRPAAFGPAGERINVILVSRLQRFKGHHVLLDSARDLVVEFPGLHVHLVGGSLFGLEEGYREELAARLDDPRLAGRVILTGFLPPGDLPAYYAHCDLLVHAALEEPFGLVLLEAMAYRRPVVATRTTGPSQIVDEGQTGLLVEPGDAPALASAIREILSDPDRARRMGDAGRQRLEGRFRVERMIARIQEEYDRLLA